MKSPPLILIVDDNPTNVEILQTRLAANNYNIITAMDGEAGLRMARDHLPDLILLDIMMPKMDGISVCRHIKSDTSLPFMPVIMVTAKAESKDIVAGLEAGGDEYLTKPVDHRALVSRVKSMLRIKELHDKVHNQSAQLKFQLETATKIQSLFWPKIPELEAGSHIWAVSVPATYVGGDFYDVIMLPDASLLVYVADVSGKGVPAALIMAALSTKIRIEAQQQSEIDTLLGIINTSTHQLISEEGFFITIVLGRYWPGTGKLQIVIGGHLPPLWLCKSGAHQMIFARGMALGVSPDTRYERNEILLSPGESILFYSDGIIEARDKNLELFGSERLTNTIANSKGPPFGKAILKSVGLWQEGTPAADDQTILEIWREELTACK
jgi:serine phosphatase RsbU (regulator of sigma subunit)